MLSKTASAFIDPFAMLTHIGTLVPDVIILHVSLTSVCSSCVLFCGSCSVVRPRVEHHVVFCRFAVSVCGCFSFLRDILWLLFNLACYFVFSSSGGVLVKLLFRKSPTTSSREAAALSGSN